MLVVPLLHHFSLTCNSTLCFCLTPVHQLPRIQLRSLLFQKVVADPCESLGWCRQCVEMSCLLWWCPIKPPPPLKLGLYLSYIYIFPHWSTYYSLKHLRDTPKCFPETMEKLLMTHGMTEDRMVTTNLEPEVGKSLIVCEGKSYCSIRAKSRAQKDGSHILLWRWLCFFKK